MGVFKVRIQASMLNQNGLRFEGPLFGEGDLRLFTACRIGGRIRDSYRSHHHGKGQPGRIPEPFQVGPGNSPESPAFHRAFAARDTDLAYLARRPPMARISVGNGGNGADAGAGVVPMRGTGEALADSVTKAGRGRNKV